MINFGSVAVPYAVLIILFFSLLGFSRKLFIKLVVFLVFEIILFILYPDLIRHLATLVGYVRKLV